MKLGVQDASISYELTDPEAKKKFVRQTYSAGQSSNEKSANDPVTSFSPKRSLRIVIDNNENNTSGRPKSAVRFQHRTTSSSTGTGPTTRRRPTSPQQQISQRNSYAPESAIHSRPITPNKHVRIYGEEPRFPVTSFRQEYQGERTPIPTITRVRKELILQDAVVPWDRSCNPPNRQTLMVEESMAKNLRAKKHLMTQNRGIRPVSAPVGHKKTIPESFARNRNSKTNGAILNLPYSELRRRDAPADCGSDSGIHEKRWNIQTKDRDDDERARPESVRDRTSLHAMYTKENAYYRRKRPVTGGAINRALECSKVL